MNTTHPLKNAKDLSHQPPRSAKLRIGGYAIMARMIDKGRATIAGTAGEYHFDCPVDNLLFSFKGVASHDVREVLESGATDREMVEWFNAHGLRKTDAEIKAWSSKVESLSYHRNDDLKKREWFANECRKVALDPADATLFDYLDADDRQSFEK